MFLMRLYGLAAAILAVTTLGSTPATAQQATKFNVAPGITIDVTQNSFGVEKWAADKCGLTSDPIKGDNRELGVYVGTWSHANVRFNLIVYRVKDDGADMGEVKVYYVTSPHILDGARKDYKCWKKYKAMLTPDGAIVLKTTSRGTTVTVRPNGDSYSGGLSTGRGLVIADQVVKIR